MERKMFLGAGVKIFENARRLRDSPTHSELLLWTYLRQKPLSCKFRRQHPISIYIADFYCHALKLIIEIDGGIHADPEVAKRDTERQDDLEKDGISFLRFSNKDVERDFDKVVSSIERYIHSRHEQTDLPNS